MKSELFKINVQDVSHAIVIAVGVAILGALQQMFGAHGLDFASYDWASIIDVTVKAVIATLGISFGANKEGKFLGMQVK